MKCNNINDDNQTQIILKCCEKYEKQSISLINPTFNKVMGHFPTFQFETNLILILPKLVCTVIIIRIL